MSYDENGNIIYQPNGKGQGRRGRPTGYRMDFESKQRISRSKQGKKRSDEVRQRISKTLKARRNEIDLGLRRCTRCSRVMGVDQFYTEKSYCRKCMRVLAWIEYITKKEDK